MKKALLILSLMFAVLVSAAQVKVSAIPGASKRKLKASETLYIRNIQHKQCRFMRVTAIFILADSPRGELVTIQVYSRPQTMKQGDKITLRSDRVIWNRQTFKILNFNCVK